MDVLDFMLAMIILCRIVYQKKLKLIYEICDADEDGFMTPADIKKMLIRVERIFARDHTRVNVDRADLDEFVADNKAELNH